MKGGAMNTDLKWMLYLAGAYAFCDFILLKALGINALFVPMSVILIAWIVVNAVDMLTTILGLYLAGIENEDNTFACAIMQKFGLIPGAILIKIGIGVPITLWLVFLVPKIAFIGICTVVAYTPARNAYLLLRYINKHGLNPINQ